MGNEFLNTTLFSLSTPPKPFSEEWRGLTKSWGKFITPIRPMSGIGGETWSRIDNSNLNQKEKEDLKIHIETSNTPGNEKVAGTVNTASVITSMATTGTMGGVATGVIGGGVVESIFMGMILSNVGPMVSKTIETPLRFVVDKLRMKRQEDNTRRFLDSEGIR